MDKVLSQPAFDVSYAYSAPPEYIYAGTPISCKDNDAQ